MTYFQEEKPRKKLSEYKCTKYEREIFTPEKQQLRTDYLIGILGDVEVDEETYKMFIKSFQTYGGMYDVRTKKETFKGIYDIISQYRELTPSAIEEIWHFYISDLFEEYQLPSLLEKYIEMFGQTDDAFTSYIDFVKRKAKLHQEKFDEDAKKVDDLPGYSKRFKDHLKGLIRRQHYTYDTVSKFLPSPELVTADEEQLLDIETKTRIYFGSCEPISYSFIETLLEEGTLDSYYDELYYHINYATKVPATFTKQDYLASITKQKTYKKD